MARNDGNRGGLPAKIKRLSSILRCPRTGATLTYKDGGFTSKTNEKYEIVDRKPVLVRVVSEANITPPPRAIISKNSSEFTLPREVPDDAEWILHLGCGEVPSNDQRVISVDVLPTEAADIVAEAESLPFADCSIDFICSDAVFEHIPNPFAAIAECKRVLKPGGLWYTNTAFMQGFHGYPSHYFNMTLQAVERYFVDDFELIDSGVPRSGSPAFLIRRLLRSFIHGLPPEEASKFLKMSVQEFHDVIDEDIRSGADRFCSMLSEADRRAFAAAVFAIARKPSDYEEKKKAIHQQIGDVPFEALKKKYYEMRQSLIERYGHIGMYRRRAEPFLQEESIKVESLTPLANVLKEGVCKDPLDQASWIESIAYLEKRYNDAQRVLGFWMRAYQRSPAAEVGNLLK